MAIPNLLTPAEDQVEIELPEQFKIETQTGDQNVANIPAANQPGEPNSPHHSSSSSSSDSETSSESSGSSESSSGEEGEGTEGEHEDDKHSQNGTEDTQIVDVDGESEAETASETLPAGSVSVKQVASSESTTPRRKRRSSPEKEVHKATPNKPSNLSKTPHSRR